MTIDPDGPRCGCGRFGCWEQFASGSALARLACARSGEHRIVGLPTAHPVRGEDVIDAARRRDPAAIEVIEEFATNVAIGLVNATEILDPEVIVLGGGLVNASDVVLEPIRAAFVRLSRPAQERRGSDLVPATLGPQAAAIGVALLSLER
jgi:glucokinase